MIEFSCHRIASSRRDIDTMVEVAQKYGFGQVSILQCVVPLARPLLGDASHVRLVGTSAFPPGSDSTSVKLLQANEAASGVRAN